MVQLLAAVLLEPILFPSATDTIFQVVTAHRLESWIKGKRWYRTEPQPAWNARVIGT